jgi:hypothetical protein
MRPITAALLVLSLLLAACNSDSDGPATDAGGESDIAAPLDARDTAASFDAPPSRDTCECGPECAGDDDCDPGRRCLPGWCGCLTCVGRALPFAGPESCPAGWDTTLAPPVPPSFLGLSACVPPRCDATGCYNDLECTEGQRCAGEDVWSALQGRCLPGVEPPACFDAEDCPPGTACEGAVACPPCRSCDTPPTAGRCEPDAGAGSVFLFVREEDWGWFSPGAIAAWWLNLGAESAYLPGCESYAVDGRDAAGESWQAGTWRPACAGGEAVVPLAPGAARLVAGLEIRCDCNPDGAIHVRLRGRYGLGCQEGVPFADAACASTDEVTSDDFWVAVPY